MNTKLVSVGKILALVVFVAVAIALGVYLVKKRNPMDLGETTPKLQGRMVAVFNNTRYAHEQDGKVKFVLTAGVDRAYENGAHELEQVKLESFGAEGDRTDSISADRAEVSDTSNLTALDAEFITNVVVKTTEGSTLKTNYLHYNHGTGIVDTKEPVAFESDTLSGTCTGLKIETKEERVHLLADVDLTVKPGTEKGEDKASKNSAAAKADAPGDETPEQQAARKAAKRARKLERKRQAALARAKSGGAAGKPGAATAGSRASTPQNSLPVAKLPIHIRAASALLERKEHRVAFHNNVTVRQGDDEMRARDMKGFLTEEDRFERLEARGDSYLKQEERAEIKSRDMDFFFNGERLVRALATGDAAVNSLGAEAKKEARASTIEAVFVPAESGSVIQTVAASGGAYLKMHAPKPANDQANPAERELTASQVNMNFHADGKFLASAQAVENAVMKVTPTRAAKGADRKTIRAPLLNAEFYDADNRLKAFHATGGVKVEVEATVADLHAPRVTTSKELAASFVADSQDIEQVTQRGDFKYEEGDRHAVADVATYVGQSEFLSLRGKRPMAWDARARTQADEIDYDRQKDETHARGDVRTTYFSRETTGDATPFKNSKSPVFITAERATARNAEGIAVYTGRARGWQDDNFVKAEQIELYEKDKRMVAIGKVESALYQVKKESESQKKEVVPGFATADRMTYSDTERLVHYNGSVKARQGTDQIEAAKVDVFLMKESNEVERMTAEGNVALAQPGRRGTGDKLVYTSEDGRAILTGRNARVEDAEKGSTIGSELTFYSRDDKVVVDNKQGTGRVRSTHRLTKNR